MIFLLFASLIVGAGLLIGGGILAFSCYEESDRRFALIGFLMQYLGALILHSSLFSIQIQISFFLSGLMSAVVLGANQFKWSAPFARRKFTPDRLFRYVLAIVLWFIFLAIERKIAVWIPVPQQVLQPAIFIIALGIIEFGLNRDLFFQFLGLLSIWLGFQMIYMLLEDSVLVFGLMIGINLLLALSGAFFLSTAMPPQSLSLEKKEEE